MLTARDAIEARIDGLDSGADDYVTKPFDFRELVARVRALARRRTTPLTPERLTVGPLTIDVRTRELLVREQFVPLTAREFALLEHLVRRHGHVVSRKEIARHVWDDSYDPLSNVIDVYVQRLRRKIDMPGQPSLIRARRGEGYQLWCEPTAT
jgi:two-component system copper resistance phosphate regulon response regulator CusR